MAQPLNDRVPITNPDGTPSQYFIRLLQERGFTLDDKINAEQALEIIQEWASQRDINVVAPITGGGSLDEDVTIGFNGGLDDLNDVDLTTPPTSGQALVYDGSEWIPGSAGSSLTVSEDDTPVAADVNEINFEGDVTVTDDGSGKVTVNVTGGTPPTPSPIWEVTDTGTGSSQDVTIPVSTSDEADLLVFVNGIRYPTSEYSVFGTTVTLTTNAAGDDIRILGIYNGGSGSGGGGSHERTWMIPAMADFTLENAGTATAVDSPQGVGIRVDAPSVASNIRFVKSVSAPPSTPYTIIGRFTPLPILSNASYPGNLILRNSGTGRIIIFGNFATGNGNYLAQRWASYTSFAANIIGSAVLVYKYPWWAIGNDGTTLTFHFSADGQEWFTHATTEALATYIGSVDQIGFGVMVNSATTGAVFNSYEVISGLL